MAVEVFEGHRVDPNTLRAPAAKVRERFGLNRVVRVGDRRMLTEARIEEELAGIEGLDWLTALHTPTICELVEQEALQLSLFDSQDLLGITHPDYPGKRLVVCRNPLLVEERARKREALLQATEHELDKLVCATQRLQHRLKGQDKIAFRVGKVLERFKVAKHFT